MMGSMRAMLRAERAEHGAVIDLPPQPLNCRVRNM
jgi:hypothetical protein